MTRRVRKNEVYKESKEPKIHRRKDLISDIARLLTLNRSLSPNTHDDVQPSTFHVALCLSSRYHRNHIKRTRFTYNADLDRPVILYEMETIHFHREFIFTQLTDNVKPIACKYRPTNWIFAWAAQWPQLTRDEAEIHLHHEGHRTTEVTQEHAYGQQYSKGDMTVGRLGVRQNATEKYRLQTDHIKTANVDNCIKILFVCYGMMCCIHYLLN